MDKLIITLFWILLYIISNSCWTYYYRKLNREWKNYYIRLNQIYADELLKAFDKAEED